MMAIIDQDGKIVFASKNGRYVMTGQTYDSWLGKHLDTENDIKESAHNIPLRKIGIDVDKLGALTLGTGKEEVTVFTDPLCGACDKALTEMSKLTQKYTFKILIVPALGDASRKDSIAIACEPDKQKALTALIKHSIPNLEAQPDCNTETYNQMLVTANTIGVKEVPFFITTDGRVMRGKPMDVDAWISGEIN
jgi:thiol:disulfide interchange protein DsbC